MLLISMSNCLLRKANPLFHAIVLMNINTNLSLVAQENDKWHFPEGNEETTLLRMASCEFQPMMVMMSLSRPSSYHRVCRPFIDKSATVMMWSVTKNETEKSICSTLPPTLFYTDRDHYQEGP